MIVTCPHCAKEHKVELRRRLTRQSLNGRGYTKEQQAAYMRDWRRNNPSGKRLTEKQLKHSRARGLSKTYYRRGVIVKQPCAHCGAPNTEMHHPDYSKPLDVVWLCRPCHLRLHAEEREREKTMMEGTNA